VHFKKHAMTKFFIFISTIVLAYSCSNNKQENKFNPKAVELDFNAANLIAKGEYDSAMVLLDSALQIDSTYHYAYGLKANIYMMKDLPDSVISQLEKQLKLAPEFAEVWSGTALLYDRKGDTLKAREYYNKSITLYDKRIENPEKSNKKDIVRSNRLNRAFNLILAGQEQKGRTEALQLKREEPNNSDTIIINGLLTKTRKEILDDYTKN
jgi:tetratricopeptide (TPR) repeat protein